MNGMQKDSIIMVTSKSIPGVKKCIQFCHSEHLNTATVAFFISESSNVHSLSSGKVEMYLCAACHAFTPHVNEWKN